MASTRELTDAMVVDHRSPRPDAAVLRLDGVSKSYGRVTAVHDFDLTVRAGEILALVGPSGCGKSTTLRLVAGLERPDSGAIRIGDESVASDRDWLPAERRRVGLVFQDHALFPHLSVAANVAFGLDKWRARRRRERVNTVLEMVGLERLSTRYPHELSGGEQQRVALARALAPEPAVVLLDEPFSNLDRKLRSQVRADTMGVLRETGTTAILVTHDQEEALAVGDRVLVMRDGGTEQLDSPDRVFHTPVNRFVATFMGEADFLPARRSRQGLDCEVGPLSPAADVAAGDEVEVMVRPHDVVLTPDASGPGFITRAEFQGAFILYTTQLPSGRTVRSLQPHTVTLPIGTGVKVGMTTDHSPTLLVGHQTVPRHS